MDRLGQICAQLENFQFFNFLEKPRKMDVDEVAHYRESSLKHFFRDFGDFFNFWGDLAQNDNFQ